MWLPGSRDRIASYQKFSGVCAYIASHRKTHGMSPPGMIRAFAAMHQYNRSGMLKIVGSNFPLTHQIPVLSGA
jgi:hypothetical protein